MRGQRQQEQRPTRDRNHFGAVYALWHVWINGEFVGGLPERDVVPFMVQEREKGNTVEAIRFDLPQWEPIH